MYTITAYPPSVGGAQLHHHQIAKEINRLNDVQVLCHWDSNRTDWLLGTTLRSPLFPKNYNFEGIPVHIIGFSIREKLQLLPGVFFFYFRMQWAVPYLAFHLRSKLDPFARQADVIHNVRIGRETISYASLKAARKFDIPFVLTPLHHPRWVGWPYKMYNDLYRMADGIIALTVSEKQKLIELGVDNQKIFVTGIGPVLSERANANRFRQELKIQGPIILFIGQLFPYKGFQQLLAAAPLVWKKVPDATFVFIGPPVSDNAKIFQAHNDNPRIRYLGKVDLQLKTDALSACDILCVPSTQESFGGVYTEAWNFSKPVIGCNIPAVSEVIENEIDGLLVQQKADDISEKIVYLLENSEVRQRFGRSGLKKVQEKYNWSTLADKTEKIYKNLMS